MESILQSQAVLIKNNGLGQSQEQLLEKIVFRIRAVKKAKRNKYVLMNAPNAKLERYHRSPARHAQPNKVPPLAEAGWSSVHSVLRKTGSGISSKSLAAAGAEGILVVPIENGDVKLQQ